uniref:Uncharacterized protein n=1 Tax=Kalanchoe fedtschenkoi TaxID=63787 RepID=A0A7N0VKU4_KALFE
MAGEGGFELERYPARRLAAVRNQIEGQRKDLQVVTAALEDLRLKKETRCAINDPPIQTFENRVATMVGSYIDELKTLEEGLRMAFIRELIMKNAEIRKFQEIKGSTSNIKDKSRLSSSNGHKQSRPCAGATGAAAQGLRFSEASKLRPLARSVTSSGLINLASHCLEDIAQEWLEKLHWN